MVNWLAVLIKYGPFVFRLIREILHMIDRSPDEDKVVFENDLIKACNYYKMTKDRTHLKNLKAKMRSRVYQQDSKKKKLTEHFTAYEKRCRCGRDCCDAMPMRMEFMAKLEALRLEWGKPLSPTSATRCGHHNEEVGGAVQSQHLLGNAVDFVLSSEADVRSLAALAEKYGFNGIGVGKSVIHIDARETPARWRYTD
jgi:zinc D-Ala-D-Ala carboxypeptidase